jgi:competence protein ComEC
LGRIGGEHFELESGLARRGERLRVTPTSDPLQRPRGPFAREPLTAAPPIRHLLADECERLGPPERSSWNRWRKRLIERALRVTDPEARALWVAFLLGDSSQLPPQRIDLFTRTGLRHLLAVSGWHVGMLAWIGFGPLALLLARLLSIGRRRKQRQRVAAWAAALLVLAYVPLAGGAAPVKRAGLALALARLAGEIPLGVSHLGRQADALSLWALALILECCAHARAPLEVGVQLSYLATLGLLLVTRPMARLLGARPRRPESLRPAGMRAWARAIGARTIGSLRWALAASLSAVLSTLPIVWSTFGEWSPIGVLATPCLVPLLAVLLLAGGLWIAAPHGCLPEPLLVWPASLLNRAIELLDLLPGTPIPLPDRPLLWLVAILVLIWSACILRGRGRAADLCARAAAALTGALLLPWEASPRRLEVVALDVGHGTCVLVRAPGEPCWIFDAGSRDRPRVAREALAPILAAWEAREPAVVVSHTDVDHTSALPWLAQRYRPRLWAGALPESVAGHLPHGTPTLDLARGHLKLPAGPGARFTLLRGGPWRGNEGSRSLAVELAGRRILLSGDAEAAGLAELLDRGELPGAPLELLLLPHHGSDTALLGSLLETTRTRRVWVSVSAPPAVAGELERRGLEWAWTGRDGPLALFLPVDPETDPHGTDLAR